MCRDLKNEVRPRPHFFWYNLTSLQPLPIQGRETNSDARLCAQPQTRWPYNLQPATADTFVCFTLCSNMSVCAWSGCSQLPCWLIGPGCSAANHRQLQLNLAEIPYFTAIHITCITDNYNWSFLPQLKVTLYTSRFNELNFVVLVCVEKDNSNTATHRNAVKLYYERTFFLAFTTR